MITRIRNVSLIMPDEIVSHGYIDIEDGKIRSVSDLEDNTCIPQEVIDGSGLYAAPGFVDIHLHGGGGVDFMGATPEEIRAGCAAHARHGTTTLLPTSVTASIEDTVSMIHAVRRAAEITEECTIAGVHLEGPFLSPAQAGAQDPNTLAVPSTKAAKKLLDAWSGGVRIMGVAPELPGGMELGEMLRDKGIRATIAHSDADYSQCAEALAHGYTDITHIYSGCSIVHRKNGYRFGGVVEAGLLEDGFTVQVIADGKHLPAELLRLIVKCKGADRVAIITDALFPAAGDYPEGAVLKQENGMEAILEDGVMKMPDRKAFAGSIATMDSQLRNMVQLAGVSLSDAVNMASIVPARIAGVDDRKGRLLPGYDADIVLLNQDLYVEMVFSRGKQIV